jgi:predicted Fe-Mo cluster-binding NifX family protein
MGILVAVTSSDSEYIDLHFGGAKSFMIFEVDTESGENRYIETRIADSSYREQTEREVSSGSLCYGHGAGFAQITDMLADCAYLLTKKIGLKPYKIFQDAGINCMEAPYLIEDALDKLNRYLRNHKN